MRIAVYHDLPSGGAKRALREQVRGLVALGHRVEAFVPSTAEEGFLPLREVAHAVHTLPVAPPPDRERMLTGDAPLADRLRWADFLFRRLRRSQREAARVIDAAGFDVVLAGASQFTQAPELLRWLRAPSLYYCQEPLRAAYEPQVAPPLTRFLIRHTLGRVDRAACRAATLVAVNSRFTAGNATAAYRRVVQVLYLGVDTGLFRPLPVERAGYVLTVAALHPLKGIDFLVESLGRVPEARRPPLLVVSDRARHAEQARIGALAHERGVRVEFRFRVPEEELVRIYNRARLVVYAPHREPFGFVPLEAMACGRPVLGVREGGIPETVVEGETGFLAERDAERFGARVAELLADPERAEEVARRALERVGLRWSWEHSVRALAAALDETARAPAHPGRGGRPPRPSGP